jgi:flagellin
VSSLVINTNIEAIAAYNNLNATDQAMSKVVNELSSGLQVQTAADDASGYVISQFLTEESNGLGQAIQNGQDAISVLQTADGAMNQIMAILQRMNELATQAANGGASSSSAEAADNAEFQALMSQIDQIANTTQFGGTQLLIGGQSGASLALTFQLGAYTGTFNQVVVYITSMTSAALGLSGAALTSATLALAAMASVQAAISLVATAEASVGADQNQIQALIANNTVAQQNIQAANSDIVDVNMAVAMTQYSSDQILMQAGVAMLAQAQQNPSLVLRLLQQ